MRIPLAGASMYVGPVSRRADPATGNVTRLGEVVGKKLKIELRNPKRGQGRRPGPGE